MYSMSRKIVVPRAKPSAAVRAMASFASATPRASVTKSALQVASFAGGGALRITVCRTVRVTQRRFAPRPTRLRTLRETDTGTKYGLPGVRPHVCWPT